MSEQQGRHGWIPGWAIALIIVGAGVILSVSLLFSGSLLWLTVASPRPVPQQAPPAPSPSPSPSSPESQERDSGDALERLRDRLSTSHEQYMDAIEDGTIYDGLPDGKNVDPNYIRDFMLLFTDLKSATLFMGGSDLASVEELSDEADELERRFHAGEDLGSSVRYVREDGTVYESDGKYRTVE